MDILCDPFSWLWEMERNICRSIRIINVIKVWLVRYPVPNPNGETPHSEKFVILLQCQIHLTSFITFLHLNISFVTRFPSTSKHLRCSMFMISIVTLHLIIRLWHVNLFKFVSNFCCVVLNLKIKYIERVDDLTLRRRKEKMKKIRKELAGEMMKFTSTQKIEVVIIRLQNTSFILYY